MATSNDEWVARYPERRGSAYPDRWSQPGSADRNQGPIWEALRETLIRLAGSDKSGISIPDEYEEKRSIWYDEEYYEGPPGRRAIFIVEVASGTGQQIVHITSQLQEVIEERAGEANRRLATRRYCIAPTEADDVLLGKISAHRLEFGYDEERVMMEPALKLDIMDGSDWAKLAGFGDWSDMWARLMGENKRPVPRRYADVLMACNLTHIAPWEVTQKLFAHAEHFVRAGPAGEGGVLAFYGAFNENGQFTSEGNKRFDAELKKRNQAYGLRDLQNELVPLAERHGFVLFQRKELPAGNLWLEFERRWDRPRGHSQWPSWPFAGVKFVE